MRIARTLSLYVMRESLIYCTLAFLLLTLILLTQNLLRRLDDLVLVGMTGADVLRVVRLLLPVALSYAIPLAFAIGILLAIRRLGHDGELVGLRSSGVGPIRFLLPFLGLALLAGLLSGWLLRDVEHQSRRELVQLFKRVAARGAILEPGKFRHVGRHLIFVEDRGRDGSLTGIMVYDQSRRDRSYRVFAPSGRFHVDERTNEIELELSQGDVHLDPRDDEPLRYQRIRFEAFTYRLPVGHLLGQDFGPVRPKQMSLPELEAVLARADAGDALRELDQRDPLAYALEIHRRRALPFAPLVLAGVGVPIALASEQRGRNLGLLLVLAAAFAYYALGSVGESLATRKLVGAAFAQWLPNLVFGFAGLGLIARSRRRIPR